MNNLSLFLIIQYITARITVSRDKINNSEFLQYHKTILFNKNKFVRLIKPHVQEMIVNSKNKDKIRDMEYEYIEYLHKAALTGLDILFKEELELILYFVINISEDISYLYTASPFAYIVIKNVRRLYIYCIKQDQLVQIYSFHYKTEKEVESFNLSIEDSPLDIFDVIEQNSIIKEAHYKKLTEFVLKYFCENTVTGGILPTEYNKNYIKVNKEGTNIEYTGCVPYIDNKESIKNIELIQKDKFINKSLQEIFIGFHQLYKRPFIGDKYLLEVFIGLCSCYSKDFKKRLFYKLIIRMRSILSHCIRFKYK